MGSARGRANHALYLARILLAAWHRDLQDQTVATNTLAQAYLPAVREHLLAAYGWFLLEITRPGALPEQPPTRLSELPGVADGKALPGEIREFQQLEAGGWLAELLSASPSSAPAAAPSAGNLAVAASPAGPEQAARWADGLGALFDRMGDSLDEY